MKRILAALALALTVMPGIAHAVVTGDRVVETSTTTGTGTLNLGGAVSGYQTFVAGVGDAQQCYYYVELLSAGEWEVGIGTVTDAGTDTLSRTTIIESSNADAAVSFSAGTKTVVATLPARVLAKHVRTETGNYTATDKDQVILCNNSAAATITLPAAAGRTGKRLVIKKISLNSLGVTIDGNASETIESLTTWPLYHATDAVEIECDGSNWRLVANVEEQKRVTTTNNTETTLWSRTLEENTFYVFEVVVVCARTGGTAGTAGDGKKDLYYAAARRVGSGAASGFSYNTISQQTVGTGGSTTLMDISTNDIRLRVTGETDVNYTWYARVRPVTAIRFAD